MQGGQNRLAQLGNEVIYGTVEISLQGGLSTVLSRYKAVKIVWRDWGIALYDLE